MIEYVDDRLGHDRRYAVDSAKVRALGWAPKRSLDEALDATFHWYRDNRWWWEPLKAPAGTCVVKILITGAGGQLGTDLARSPPANGITRWWPPTGPASTWPTGTRCSAP